MDAVPAKLKPAEVGRFIHRANQLRHVKPAMTYWCEYYAVNQILSKQLHNADEECLAYTSALMDRLEQLKAEHAEDDAIADDTAGQAYVEQFAQQTFERGEKVLRANKVTRQTADTFDAAATFFQLISVFTPLDEETQKKIKFAKWNAARILRAIKEGRDPNESNPRHDETAVPEDEDNETREPEPRRPPKAAAAAASPAIPPPAQHATAFTPPSPESRLSPSHPPGHVPSPYSRVSQSPAPNSHPQSPEPPTAAEPFASPQIPRRTSLHFPEASASDTYTPPPVDVRPTFPGPSVMTSAPQQQQPPPPPKAPTSAPWPQTNNSSSLAPSTHGFGQQYSQSPVGTPGQQQPHHHPLAQSPVSASAAAPQHMGSYGAGPVDDASIAKAEKHAKWAISALNFDDVPTAVKELRNALETLGAK